MSGTKSKHNMVGLHLTLGKGRTEEQLCFLKKEFQVLVLTQLRKISLLREALPTRFIKGTSKSVQKKYLDQECTILSSLVELV